MLGGHVRLRGANNVGFHHDGGVPKVWRLETVGFLPEIVGDGKGQVGTSDVLGEISPQMRFCRRPG